MLESLMLELVDTYNENGRHIYEWNQIKSIKQAIFEIDKDRTQ